MSAFPAYCAGIELLTTFRTLIFPATSDNWSFRSTMLMGISFRIRDSYPRWSRLVSYFRYWPYRHLHSTLLSPQADFPSPVLFGDFDDVRTPSFGAGIGLTAGVLLVGFRSSSESVTLSDTSAGDFESAHRLLSVSFPVRELLPQEGLHALVHLRIQNLFASPDCFPRTATSFADGH